MLPSSVQRFVAESPIHRTAITGAVAAFANGLPADAAVLDAGAGDAPYRPLFAHCEYLAQDWGSTVHAGGLAADVVADLHDLPLPVDRFDAVVMTEVLEHVAEPALVLTELRRVLRPGGRLLLTVPFVGELHEEPHDHYRYTSYGIRGLLDRAGFVVETVEPLTGWFSTLAHVLRNQGLATCPTPRRQSLAQRAVAGLFRLLSSLLARAAPALDRRLDTRQALPLGWLAVAAAPAHAEGGS